MSKSAKTKNRITAERLQRLFVKREASIAVVGMGYVGLPLAVEFADAGFTVTGIDVNPRVIETLSAGASHIEDVPDEAVSRHVDAGRLRLRERYRGIGGHDAVVICVPTPLRKTKDPDISYIVAAVDELARELRRGQLVVLESTTYPGTTEEVVRPRLEAGGLRAGRDFFLAFSPERVDPGNTVYTTRNTPKVVGGSSPTCTRVAATLYEQAVEHVHRVSTAGTAEMIKLLENTFRAVNIGLVNEIALMCEKLDLDVWEVIEGAATKPFGFMKFLPGPGIGGHCIPLDPHYLSWKLKTLDFSARFIELASEINGNMPKVVVRRAAELLNDRRKSIKGSRLLVLGVAYKRDTSDTRESPALDVMRLLDESGARVRFHDPYNREVTIGDGRRLRRSALNERSLRATDLVIIVTDHSEYDYSSIVRWAPLLLDTRNATAAVRAGRTKVHKL